ncbi:MAG: lipoyl(octanoyl) transferase LipB [Tannerellaceae bacterium]|jgi:lipoyl(octanoyl) transferase|nr:lipoyl(octanoyl) transferase LipB [Tannerellaceae bacterium]
MESFTYHDAGQIAYAGALEMQTQAFNSLLEEKANGRQGVNKLFFCEHQPVFTLGKNAAGSNLLVSEKMLQQQGIALYHTNRGGDITFHGPGQITGYPVFDLEYWEMGLKQYVYVLEEIMIRFLDLYGIAAGRLKGATGVWIEPHTGRDRKICAIGLKSSRYVTMHGFALNINTRLTHYTYINPCGFTDKGVTSLEKETGVVQDIECCKKQLLMLFREAFPFACHPKDTTLS